MLSHRCIWRLGHARDAGDVGPPAGGFRPSCSWELTVVACLPGLGLRHYLIDLLIAIPFTVGLWSLGGSLWWVAVAGLSPPLRQPGWCCSDIARGLPLVLAGVPLSALLLWQLRNSRAHW